MLLQTLLLAFYTIQANGRVSLPQTPDPIVSFNRTQPDDCKLNINSDLKEPQPLIVYPDRAEFVLPQTTNAVISLTTDEEVEFHCSESFKAFDAKFVRAKCLYGKKFQVGNIKFDIKDFGCTKVPRHVARVVATCGNKNDSKLIHVGYDVDDMHKQRKRFIKLYEICFDSDTDRPLYSHNHITPAHLKNQDRVPRPSFTTGTEKHFTSDYVDSKYKRKNQLKVLGEMFDLSDDEEIRIKENHFFSRGHLAPKADFILANHQRATFYLQNVSPQFQDLNAGTWAKVEDAVRRLAAARDTTLDVYTGTLGVLQIRDKHDQLHDYYFNRDANNNGLIPVPDIFYKLIVDTKTRHGVVLIGVNDPFATTDKIRSEYIYCPDISEKLKWIQVARNRPENGYFYACTVEDFKEHAEFLPVGNVKGLLV